MIFSDTDILRALKDGKITISPFNEAMLRAASYTLTLGSTLYRLKEKSFIDTRVDKQDYEEINLSTEEGYLLEPGSFIVGRSSEKITLSNEVAGFLSTTGSRAQHGLDAILSSAFMEPGSDNQMALELHNVSRLPIKLFPGIRLVKAIFFPLETPASQGGRGRDFFLRQGLA